MTIRKPSSRSKRRSRSSRSKKKTSVNKISKRTKAVSQDIKSVMMRNYRRIKDAIDNVVRDDFEEETIEFVTDDGYEIIIHNTQPNRSQYTVHKSEQLNEETEEQKNIIGKNTEQIVDVDVKEIERDSEYHISILITEKDGDEQVIVMNRSLLGNIS